MRQNSTSIYIHNCLSIITFQYQHSQKVTKNVFFYDNNNKTVLSFSNICTELNYVDKYNRKKFFFHGNILLRENNINAIKTKVFFCIFFKHMYKNLKRNFFFVTKNEQKKQGKITYSQ